jgi:hypothetical protein
VMGGDAVNAPASPAPHRNGPEEVNLELNKVNDGQAMALGFLGPLANLELASLDSSANGSPKSYAASSLLPHSLMPGGIPSPSMGRHPLPPL